LLSVFFCFVFVAIFSQFIFKTLWIWKIFK
jgi:hypothetical protein